MDLTEVQIRVDTGGTETAEDCISSVEIGMTIIIKDGIIRL
jgi:hypothetical protein